MRFSVAGTVGATPPTPGIVPDSSVANSGGVTVDEGGAAVSFGMRLETAPSADVTITLAITPSLAGVAVTPASLTFTAADWQTPQPVTVDASGHDDTDRVDETTDVTLTATSTGDPNYHGLTSQIQVTVTDDDKPALIVDPGSVTVVEGSTADITVQLKTAPAVAVTVAATSDNPTAATVAPASLTFAAGTVAPASLTFAAGTGQTPQMLTVTGVDDADTANAAATVTLTAASIGPGYNGLTWVIAVSVTDDDMPALTLTRGKRPELASQPRQPASAQRRHGRSRSSRRAPPSAHRRGRRRIGQQRPIGPLSLSLSWSPARCLIAWET